MKNLREALFIFADGKVGKVEESLGNISRTGFDKDTYILNINTRGCPELFSIQEMNKAWKACGFPGKLKKVSDLETGFGRTHCYVKAEDFSWPSQFIDVQNVKIYCAYDSEDEGFHFPWGAPSKSLEELRQKVCEELGASRKSPMKLIKKAPFNEKDLEKFGLPNCHGELVEVWCAENLLKGERVTSWFKKLNPKKAYALDWLFIYKIEAQQ